MALTVSLGIVALVLMVSALASGIVERAPVSFPMIFLALGFVLGPIGIGLVRLSPDNQVLHIVAVLALSLVLFLDAVNLERAQERHDLVVPRHEPGAQSADHEPAQRADDQEPEQEERPVAGASHVLPSGRHAVWDSA